MKRLAIVLLLCSLASCGRSEAISKGMDSWKGAPMTRLIASWGPPHRIIEDENGGRILVYDYGETVEREGTSVTYPTGITVKQPNRTSRAERWRMFWIDAKGKVVRWSWRGW